ncbi:hypothetical protein Salat_2937800 [Sesamum alatum]|uniref:Uncharacterized protein n=1 Tax=Sesamum alatum TaxID=300844 RepID=A0AAE1XK38_9LAMI|nr:hypothetical protein Salat_2937800 [Sesamum alatum]
MDSRRRQKWDSYRRSQNKRPPRGSWQPTVPSWEKEFCKVVGSLDWETLLQMKRFMHLYENVIKWNDSAGEEALSQAKKRFWAEINGLPCDISLPDPDLYIDKIDWDSAVDPQMQSDIEFEPMISNADEDHDPVVIFGDSLFPNQAYSVTGWGDDEENFKVPAKSSSANHGDPWEQNWGNSFDKGAATGWSDYCDNAWKLGDGSGPTGYMSWDAGGWNNNRSWNCANNNMAYERRPDIEHEIAGTEQGTWNDNNLMRVNTNRHVSSDRALRVQGNERYRNYKSTNENGRHKAAYWGQRTVTDKRRSSREWNSFSSCRPVNHHAAISVGQTWNQ